MDLHQELAGRHFHPLDLPLPQKAEGKETDHQADQQRDDPKAGLREGLHREAPSSFAGDGASMAHMTPKSEIMLPMIHSHV
jgi:hypothetical protein